MVFGVYKFLMSMKNYFKIIIPVLLVIVFIVKVIIPQSKINSRCVTYDKFLSIKLNGVVINKYVDSSQHSYKTIEVMDLKDSTVIKLILDFDTTNLFNHISLHDTIYKGKNEDSIFVIKGERNYFLSKVDFGCVR